MNGWYESRNPKTVVIFVHGLFSNSEQCWTSPCGIFWPELLVKDLRITTPSIFLADFYTSLSSNDYGIQECAKEVYDSLLSEDTVLNTPPIERDNIVFITHSTGGIVVRYILEAYSDTFIGKNIGLCLYASPSYGSKLSSLFGWVAKLCNNKLAQELSWGSDILTDLDDRFINLIHSEKLRITGMEAFENKMPFNIPFMNIRVVEKSSAARYFGNRKLIPNSDHSSIVKPRNIESYSHQTLIRFFAKEKFLVRNNNSPMTNPSLFTRYQVDFEDYYIQRNNDIEIHRILSQYSIWLWGAAGTGKTASIFRAIYLQDKEIKYISLGACIGKDLLGLFEVIYSELVDSSIDSAIGERVDISSYIKLISENIRSCSLSEDFFLIIEEIPIIDQTIFTEFSKYICALITSLSNCNGFRLVLSSIFQPNIEISLELQKINETLKFIEWELWLDSDIERLVTVISKDTGLYLKNECLINLCDNTPRNVKNYFRDELSKSTIGEIKHE